MARHRFYTIFTLLMIVPSMAFGEDEIPGGPHFNSYITINGCCNESAADDEIKQELQTIKELLNTLKTSLQNGEYCSASDTNSYIPRDCYEIQQVGQNTSGVYTIQPFGSEPFSVYCDMDTDGGGWTVFQRRQDGSVDFYVDWADYENGFGSPFGEHWLGNKKLFYLSNQDTYKLRVDLEDFEADVRYAVYDSFVISNPPDKYRLTLGNYSGNAEDSMTYHNGQQFSTRDQDNDLFSGQCAERYKGAWWYQSCHFANLNGLYLSGPHSPYGVGIVWYHWKGYLYSLKLTELKMKPV